MIIGKTIFSSAALLKVMIGLNDKSDYEIRINDNGFYIDDVWKADCEHSKSIETTIQHDSVVRLIKLLQAITDQPIVICFTDSMAFNVEISSIML